MHVTSCSALVAWGVPDFAASRSPDREALTEAGRWLGSATPRRSTPPASTYPAGQVRVACPEHATCTMQWAARELREPRTCPSLPTMQLREKRRQRCCPSKCSPWPPLPLAAVGSPSSLRCPTISSVTAARNKGVGHRRAGETKSNHQDCCGSRMKDAHRAAQAEARRAGQIAVQAAGRRAGGGAPPVLGTRGKMVSK